MTDEEIVDDYIAKGDAKGLKEWELARTHKITDSALLHKIDTFLKSKGEWYGDNAHREGA